MGWPGKRGPMGCEACCLSVKLTGWKKGNIRILYEGDTITLNNFYIVGSCFSSCQGQVLPEQALHHLRGLRRRGGRVPRKPGVCQARVCNIDPS